MMILVEGKKNGLLVGQPHEYLTCERLGSPAIKVYTRHDHVFFRGQAEPAAAPYAMVFEERKDHAVEELCQPGRCFIQNVTTKMAWGLAYLHGARA
jgi:hypothetical protein